MNVPPGIFLGGSENLEKPLKKSKRVHTQLTSNHSKKNIDPDLDLGFFGKKNNYFKKNILFYVVVDYGSNAGSRSPP